LTVWQAKFRRWYLVEAAKNPAEPPQEVQRRCDQYNALVTDLKRTSENLVELADGLRRIAYGR
jgi:hypothetical protein